MKKVEYRWKKERVLFDMPIEIVEGKEVFKVIPTSKWQKIKVSNFENMRLRFNWKPFLYDIAEVKK